MRHEQWISDVAKERQELENWWFGPRPGRTQAEPSYSSMTQSAANPQRSGRDPRRALAATKDECPGTGLHHPLFSVASTLIRSRASKECEAGGGRRGRARRAETGWGSEGWGEHDGRTGGE